MNFIKDMFSPKKGYNNKSTATIKKYGDLRIMKINVYRKPVEKALTGVLNLISLGKFNKGKDKTPYDRLFHLGLFCILKNENAGYTNVLCEKNAVVEITKTTFDINKFGETMVVNVSGDLTLNELLEGGQEQLGDKYFPYNPWNNNCQWYIRALLQGSPNNIDYTDKLNEFVFQDIEEIVKETPKFSQKIASGITTLGGLFDKVIGGNLTLHAIKIKKNVDKNKQLEHIKHITNSNKTLLMKEMKNVNSYRVIPKTKFKNKSWKSKKVNSDITLVFGELK
jgi:hypothetical protein